MPVGAALMVALIVLREGTVLALPKGHIEPGESPEETARRETREETGLLGATLAPLEEISYWFYSRHQRARIAKRVSFYLLLYRAGSPAHHNAEVEGVRFAPLERAAAMLAYPGERQVVRAAEARVLELAGSGAAAAKGAAAGMVQRSALLETGGPLCSR